MDESNMMKIKKRVSSLILFSRKSEFEFTFFFIYKYGL